MSFVIVDTEYTTWPGALESGWSLPGQHREIVQIAAIKFSNSFQAEAEFDVLIRPSINPRLSELFIELTGITQDMVDTLGTSFVQGQSAFFEFCKDATLPTICMNADEAVFRENCRLNNVEFPFHLSWHRLRPYLENLNIDVTRFSSGDLHRLTLNPLPNGRTHNAFHDVRSMGHWLQHSELGRQQPVSFDQLPTGAPTFDPRSNKVAWPSPS